MNGWLLAAMVVLALFAGAGAHATLQAFRPCPGRHQARHSGGPDSGSGRTAGPGRPEPAPRYPDDPPEPDEPWYQEIRPPQPPTGVQQCAYCGRQIARLTAGNWADGDGLTVCQRRRADEPYQLHQPATPTAPWQAAPLPDTTIDGQPRVPGYLG